MKNKLDKNGFTLVEIIVAMTVIVAIFSMVYGSYFATSKSTQAYKSRIILFKQERKLLEQMARQIRCSFASTTEKNTPSITLTSQQKKEISEGCISYFDSDQNNPSGEILHFVTTGGSLGNRDLTGGLFDVAYKYDKDKSTLFLGQRRFTGELDTTKIVYDSAVQKRNWQPVARNLSHVKLLFFDGKQWLKYWNYNDKKILPSAVRIGITCEDENYRQYHHNTTVYVYCQNNQGVKTQVEKLVAIKK